MFTVVEKDSEGITSIDPFQTEEDALELFDGLLDYFKSELSLVEIAEILKNKKFVHKSGYSIEMMKTV